MNAAHDTMTPRALPELRHTILTHPVLPAAAEAVLRDVDNIHPDGTPASGGPDIRSQVKAMTLTLEHAELHYIGEEFTGLVAAAASTLPPTPLAESDLPSPVGLAYFAAPLPNDRTGDDARYIALWATLADVRAVLVWWLVDAASSWAMTYDLSDGATPLPLSDALAVMPPYMLSDYAFLPLNSDAVAQVADASPGSHPWLTHHLLATWHMQRQRITVERTTGPERAAARRLARAGSTSPTAVRVINLRGADEARAEGDVSAREYRNRWIVRGHWRQHWYPSLQDRRPVWIAPHVKGPDGAPLLVGEKVQAWAR